MHLRVPHNHIKCSKSVPKHFLIECIPDRSSCYFENYFEGITLRYIDKELCLIAFISAAQHYCSQCRYRILSFTLTLLLTFSIELARQHLFSYSLNSQFVFSLSLSPPRIFIRSLSTAKKVCSMYVGRLNEFHRLDGFLVKRRWRTHANQFVH